jgi:hypothetical protein
MYIYNSNWKTKIIINLAYFCGIWITCKCMKFCKKLHYDTKWVTLPLETSMQFGMETTKERISIKALPFFMHNEFDIGKKVFIMLLLGT